MEQHYPHFEMPQNYKYHLDADLKLIDQMSFPTYLQAFSGVIPPQEVEPVANLIVNTLRQCQNKTEQDLNNSRRYIKVLPNVIYLLDANVPLHKIVEGLKAEGFSDEDIAQISQIATSAAVSVRAGEFAIATNPGLDKDELDAIEALTKLAQRNKDRNTPTKK